ncbi:MAG: hypothetical protein H6823_13555 [Planctomycetaceae bacterium]|nr:hypothetical protein [Planctomycetaceae bacterium]
MSKKSETVKLQQVLDAVEALRAEVNGLNQRLAALEAVTPAVPLTMRTSASAEQLSEELVLTISAAIAAYLGVKPHIRQIRLLGSASWAQHGRATIQASHALAVQHG